MYNPWESNVPVYLEAVTSKLNQHNFYLIDHVKMLQKVLRDCLSKLGLIYMKAKFTISYFYHFLIKPSTL